VPKTSLLRVLGAGFGVAVIVGNTIGGGILRTPGEVARSVSSDSIYMLVWFAGALYALLGANLLSELGAMLSRSGGQYVFAREAFGDYAGFVVGWSDWISTCGSAAAVSIVAGESIRELFPALALPASRGALIVLLFFTAIQLFGIRSGSLMQSITSIVKTLAFVALIGACFWWSGSPPSISSDGSSDGSNSGSIIASSLVAAIGAVIYTYDGWNGAIYFSGEMKDPGREIPRSMFGGVLLVAAIYLLLNFGFLQVANLQELGQSTFAAATVTERIFGTNAGVILRVIMLISMFGAVNAFQLFASRVLHGLASDRLFVASAARVTERGTPAVALLIGTFISALFLIGSFERAIAILSFFFVANYTISFSAFFRLRKKQPARPRPFRARLHPFSSSLALVLSILFLGFAIVSDPASSGIALLALALSYPLYLFTKKALGSPANE